MIFNVIFHSLFYRSLVANQRRLISSEPQCSTTFMVCSIVWALKEYFKHRITHFLTRLLLLFFCLINDAITNYTKRRPRKSKHFPRFGYLIHLHIPWSLFWVGQPVFVQALVLTFWQRVRMSESILRAGAVFCVLGVTRL